MRTLIILLLTSSCFTKVMSGFQSLDEVKKNCTQIPMGVENSNLAFYGWPLVIDCRNLAVDLEYDYVEDSSTIDTTCQIWAPNGTSVFNTTQELYDLYDEYPRDTRILDIPEVRENNTNFTISFKLNDEGCFYKVLDFNLTNPKICEEFKSTRKPVPFFPSLGEMQTLTCKALDEDYPKLPDTYKSQYTYEWRRSCSESIINTNKQLVFTELKEEDGGDYICFVYFNGMKRTLASYNLCLRKKPTLNSAFSVTCKNNILRKQIGQTATFSCRVSFADGRPDGSELIVQLVSGGNIVESKANGRCLEDSLPADLRQFCFIDYGPKCVIPEDLSVPFNLTIRNITESDYGDYTIRSSSMADFVVNTTLTLKRNEIPALLSAAEITGICIAILLIFIFISLLVFYNFIYVKVFYKRWFATFVPNDKKYGVFLAYHFSQEIDRFAQATVKESIQKIRHLLDEMGYLVFDEKRQFNASGRADSIHASVENCHRILILLSAEFIKDDWSLFALQEGFNEMVSSGTKLIFVLLPGMKEYLKQLGKTDDTVYQVIQRALKFTRNSRLKIQMMTYLAKIRLKYALKWNRRAQLFAAGRSVLPFAILACFIAYSCKVNYVIQMPDHKRLASKRFTFQLENALPKLHKVGLERLMSISSGCSSLNRYENGQFKTQASTITTLSVETKEELAV